MARILIADDDEDIMIIVQTRLMMAGHVVDWAKDGEEAIQMFEKNPPDLVILDLHLPVLNGYEVCDRMKNSSHKNIPVLYLSAAMPETIMRASETADGFLGKPFEYTELLATVEKLVQKKRAL